MDRSGSCELKRDRVGTGAHIHHGAKTFSGTTRNRGRGERGEHILRALRSETHLWNQTSNRGKTDPFTLAKIMGHANLRTIMRYVHPDDGAQREAMRRYAEAIQ